MLEIYAIKQKQEIDDDKFEDMLALVADEEKQRIKKNMKK